MADPTWEAKIMLTNSSTPQTVRVTAFNSSQAQKAIEAMYGKSIKSWMFHPYIVIDEHGRKV